VIAASMAEDMARIRSLSERQTGCHRSGYPRPTACGIAFEPEEALRVEDDGCRPFERRPPKQLILVACSVAAMVR